ncbi:MAG: HD domain-containing protein [Candidatus Caldatribacteriota bacterium]|nr:HD domain-containing protein [Candidatus Caldatribacteriota bacterium]
MNKEEIIKKTEDFVRKTFQEENTGHDWWHTHRVRILSKKIARDEKADLFIVDIVALLHDVGDYKFFGGDEKEGLLFVKKWLSSLEISDELIERILEIISKISFKNTLPESKNQKYKNSVKILSKEFMAVCDADRLDAMGAIGIARTFTYGGFYKRAIYNPQIKLNRNITQEEYKTTDAPSINHFYEKLLKLKSMMHTKLGKKIARKRHRVLKLYLKEFFKEWKGKM